MTASFLMGTLIFMWPPGSWWHWPQCWCLEPPDLLDLNETDELVDTELMSLSNPWSHEGEEDGVGATQGSCHLWPQSWLHCNAWPHSWYDTQWLCLGTSNHSSVVGSLTSHGGSSWLQKLNGGDTGRIQWGCLGPLTSMHCSVMTWVINH